MKVLLAEDEKAMSMALCAVLEHSGCQVDPVYDGQAAVDKARQNIYDAMIFDIMMPVKDGITALTELRQEGDRTPVIMLTAKAEVDDRITGLDAGADDYLTKPFAMGELLELCGRGAVQQKQCPAFAQGNPADEVLHAAPGETLRNPDAL